MLVRIYASPISKFLKFSNKCIVNRFAKKYLSELHTLPITRIVRCITTGINLINTTDFATDFSHSFVFSR